MNTETIEMELLRLRGRGLSREVPTALGAVDVLVDELIKPEAYLSRVVDVLAAAVSLAGSVNFDQDFLREDSIPEWFARVSAASESERGLADDVSLRGSERYQESHDEGPWDLQEWLFSFDPERRPWAWWGGVISGRRATLWIDTHGEPVIASHNFRWLAYVAGASSVSALELRRADTWQAAREGH